MQDTINWNNTDELEEEDFDENKAMEKWEKFCDQIDKLFPEEGTIQMSVIRGEKVIDQKQEEYYEGFSMYLYETFQNWFDYGDLEVAVEKEPSGCKVHFLHKQELVFQFKLV